MAGLKRLLLCLWCLFVATIAGVTANEATGPAAESGTETLAESVSLEGEGRIEEKETVTPSALTDEEDATIRAIWAQLEEKDNELLAVKAQAQQYQAIEADLRAKLSSTATEIEEYAKKTATVIEEQTKTIEEHAKTIEEFAKKNEEQVKTIEEHAKTIEDHAKIIISLEQKQKELEVVNWKLVEKEVFVDNPATEEALQQLTNELNKVKLELEVATASAHVAPDMSVVDKLSTELSTCQSESSGLLNELKIKSELVANLQATIENTQKTDNKPKLSNRPQDDTPPKKSAKKDDEDANSSMPPLDLDGFIVFLQEKYTTFLSDLEKSPVLAQISAAVLPIYSDTQRYMSTVYSDAQLYVKNVLIPYLQKDLIPQIQHFYSKTLVPYVAQLIQKIAKNYAIVQPKVLKWLKKMQKKAQKFINTVVVPAYENNVRPPVVEMYTTHIKPTMDDVIVPWYHTQVSPHVITITATIQTFYNQHLQRHVEPVLDIVWRQFNLVLYKTMNFLDPETFVETVTFAATDVYLLAKLAHETFVTQMKLNPTMRAVFGQHLNSVIQGCVYVGSFVIVFFLWRLFVVLGMILALFVLRPILYIVFLPLIIVMRMTSGVWGLIFGTRNPRSKSTHANSGTAINKKPSTTTTVNQGGTSVTTRSAAANGVNGHSSSNNNGQQLHSENGYQEQGVSTVTSSSSPSYPPSAVSKPLRPGKSVVNNLMPQTTTHSDSIMPVGSPFPVAATTDND